MNKSSKKCFQEKEKEKKNLHVYLSFSKFISNKLFKTTENGSIFSEFNKGNATSFSRHFKSSFYLKKKKNNG